MKVNSTTEKEDLFKGYTLTVGKLKKFIEEHNLPDDAPVLIERIEDVYFEKHNWSVYLKEGESFDYLKKFNEDIESGKYLDKEQYPKIKPENLILSTEEELTEAKDQYFHTHCCVFYKDDPDILFITSHY
jgi:hypothetical protein